MASKESCKNCTGTGVIVTGNNDLPCDCGAGDVAVFNVGSFNRVPGSLVKRHLLNFSPEPLDEDEFSKRYPEYK